LSEENFSYICGRKKLGRSKVSVSKWIKALEDESGGIILQKQMSKRSQPLK